MGNEKTTFIYVLYNLILFFIEMPIYSFFLILKMPSTQGKTLHTSILSLETMISYAILMPSLNRRNSYSNCYQQLQLFLALKLFSSTHLFQKSKCYTLTFHSTPKFKPQQQQQSHTQERTLSSRTQIRVTDHDETTSRKNQADLDSFLAHSHAFGTDQF